MINIIVQPVGKKQIGVRAPVINRLLAGVVVWKIVERQRHLQTVIDVALIFVAQGIEVVFRVAADEKLFAFLVADNMNTGLGRYRQHTQLRPPDNGFRVRLRMPGMGRKIFLVKAAEKPRFGV